MEKIIDIVKEIEETKNSPLSIGKKTDKLDLLWTKLYLVEQYQPFRIVSKLVHIIEDLTNLPFYYHDIDPIMIPKYFDFPIDKSLLTNNEVELILDHIVFDTRTFLEKTLRTNIDRETLKGMCITASEYIIYNYHQYFDCYILKIQNIFPKSICHFFVVINFDTINGLKSYIIDTTYRQFCTIGTCNKNRIYHFENIIAPGYFFKDKEVVKKLLRDGYISLDEYTGKIYGDSFILASGIENEITGKEYMKTYMTGKKIKIDN